MQLVNRRPVIDLEKSLTDTADIRNKIRIRGYIVKWKAAREDESRARTGKTDFPRKIC